MKRVRIFLRTELFSVSASRGGTGPSHVPSGVMILEGTLRETDRSGAFLVEASGFQDLHGKALDSKPVVLILPSAKVDHIHVIEE
jgi:hypothetical protein